MSRILPLSKSFAIVAATTLLIAASGCVRSTHLAPAPGAHVVAPNVASATKHDVKVKAQPGAWNGRPQDLGRKYTPLLVSVTDRGNKPIVIRYSDFTMVGSNGRNYYAIPPFNASGNVTESHRYRIGGFYSDEDFYAAPYYGGFWEGPVYQGPFDWDEAYWNSYSVAWNVHLPTRDMVNRALPEGVLNPGGKVSGFLYFQKPPSNLNSVRLRAKFKTPKNKKFNGGRVASMTIPFTVK